MTEDTPTRRCPRCGERKCAATAFYRNPRNRDCRECFRKYLKERSKERADYITAHKLEHGCADCGYRESAYALQYDHRPGEVKLFGIHMLRHTGSWQQMLDEIAKCDVVCANCHAIRTHSRPPAMANYDLRRPVKPVTGIYAEDRDQLPLFTP